MKRYFIFIILLCGLVSSIEAQIFQATDIIFSKDISESEKQSMRKKALGQEVKLTTFDKDIKMETISKYNGSSQEPIIFHEESDGRYKFTDRSDIIFLSIDKILGYYKSLKIEVWNRDEYQWTVIMKRK